MNKSKIIKKYFNNKLIKNLRKAEIDMLKSNNIMKNLSEEEKKIISKRNLRIAKIMKNTYYNWEETDKRYFISDIYYQTELLPKLNDINYDKFGLCVEKNYFSDKNYEERNANLMKFPDCVIRCIDGFFYDKDFNYINFEEALKKINNYDNLVFKKSIGEGHGKNVSLICKKNYEDAIKSFGKNFVVQEIISQHKFLASFNNSSVNVIRVTSLLWKGKVYILGGIFRVGAPGSFCDHLSNNKINPRIVGLDESGNLIPYAVDPVNIAVYNDVFGQKIEGQIPFYTEIKEKICKQHLNFIHHKIIGWDITINSNNEIICIEFNSNCPGVIQTQMVCGPIFGKKINNGEILLNEILNNYKN